MKYENGQPCDHKGCLQHLTHPCEGCGRIAGRYVPLCPNCKKQVRWNWEMDCFAIGPDYEYSRQEDLVTDKSRFCGDENVVAMFCTCDHFLGTILCGVGVYCIPEFEGVDWEAEENSHTYGQA